MAYARNFTDQQWYEYDDGCVSRVASAKVAGTEAYVLLYKRDDSAVAPLRTELYKMVSTLQVWGTRRLFSCIRRSVKNRLLFRPKIRLIPMVVIAGS